MHDMAVRLGSQGAAGVSGARVCGGGSGGVAGTAERGGVAGFLPYLGIPLFSSSSFSLSCSFAFRFLATKWQLGGYLFLE